MNCDVNKKYNIGLDIGTASVGWAVMQSSNFKIMKKGGKKLWGVRLFDQAETAEQRRLYRSTRRRYDRRRKRISLLQDIFKDEINKVDPTFYQKLRESAYNKNDIKNKTITISAEEQSQIIKYNKKFPTIYHLRKELLDNKEQKDIRLVYLAIHHIIKHRGNFLYSSDNFNVNNLNIIEKINELFTEIIEHPNLEFDENLISLIDQEKLKNALLQESKKDKELLIKENIKCLDNKNFISEFTKLMIGNKSDVIKMFNVSTDKALSISFKGTDFEDKFEELETTMGEYISILEEIKELYDMLFLKNLFKGAEDTNISSLMVSKYMKHKEDLRFLKDILSYDKAEYRKVFRSTEKNPCIFDKYIKNGLDYKSFASAIKKSLEKSLEKVSDKKLIDVWFQIKLAEIENEQFMPKITNSDNGKYPYQLNKNELNIIIENQGKYYPFLLDKIGDTYKIEKILTFKIPYYVGPLNNTTSIKGKTNPNAWLVRRQNNVSITPFNFEEVVDLSSSAQKFITRMISNCTYILKEPAIPANSILYSKYKVFNELKQIKVNNHRLTPDTINKIYQELFLKNAKTITEKIFINYLKTLEEFPMNDLKVEGYSADKKFANNMKPYVDFFGPNGIFEGTNCNENDAENIISWITIFEDKDILKTKIKEEYPDLSSQAINKILSKRYKGWSSLSRLLLENKYYEDKENNRKLSIMDLLIETEKNFMQIINDKKYKFQKMIDDFNSLDNIHKLNYEVVADLATSPAVKRGIY